MKRLAGCLLACTLAMLCAPAEEDRGWKELIQAAREAHAGGRTDEAIELGLQALEGAERGTQDQQVLVSLSELASFHEERGEPDQAVLYGRRALDLRESLSGSDDLGLVAGYTELAEQYQQLGDVSQAVFCLRRALEIRERGLGQDDLGAARISSDLGLLLMAGGWSGPSIPWSASCRRTTRTSPCR
jgi:tetratricopeptide (TPR) repeat protein